MIIEILAKIDMAVLNPTTIHVLDERRVNQLFADMIVKYGKYDQGDISRIVSGLGNEYRDYTRKRISEIAEANMRSYLR